MDFKKGMKAVKKGAKDVAIGVAEGPLRAGKALSGAAKIGLTGAVGPAVLAGGALAGPKASDMARKAVQGAFDSGKGDLKAAFGRKRLLGGKK